MTRKELNDRQDKHDAFISKLGQKEATRYLKAKEQAQPNGRIREAIAAAAFLTFISIVTIALLLM